MTGLEEAIAALQTGAYEEANRILETLGANKPGASPLRGRMLWAITQILRMHFTNETAEAILEVDRRTPNATASIYEKAVSAVGPLESLLMPAAVHEVRLRIGGYFLRRGGSEHEASPWLKAACAADPDDAIAAYLEANCRFVLYRERQAVSDMKAVLEKSAADRERAYLMSGRTEGFYYHLAEAYEKTENLEDAAAYYAKALEINPANDIPRAALGAILMRLGRFAEAVEQLAKVNEHAADYISSAQLRAIGLFRMGNTDDAITLLHEIAELDPLAALTFLELGRIHMSCGKLDLAEIALARAFRTDPGLPGLNAAIIRLESLLGRHMDADAGLPTAAEFAIPEQFAPRLDELALLARPQLKRGVASYFRVVHALIVRDIFALYSHSGMGYFWALAQPLAYIATIVAVYMVAGHKAPMGTSVVAYLAAGIVPYVSFYVRLQSAVSSAVRSNVGLLYFRQVTPFAMISAAVVREFLTSLVVFVIIAAGIASFDDTVNINDPLTILVALVLISLLGAVVGALFGLGELVFPSVQLLETVVARAMLFFSGALYYANFLPPHLRRVALFNPLFHLIEFVRNGFFATYHSHYASWTYAVACIGGGIVLTMVVLSTSRRYMVAA